MYVHYFILVFSLKNKPKTTEKKDLAWNTSINPVHLFVSLQEMLRPQTLLLY